MRGVSSYCTLHRCRPCVLASSAYGVESVAIKRQLVLNFAGPCIQLLGPHSCRICDRGNFKHEVCGTYTTQCFHEFVDLLSIYIHVHPFPGSSSSLCRPLQKKFLWSIGLLVYKQAGMRPHFAPRCMIQLQKDI